MFASASRAGERRVIHRSVVPTSTILAWTAREARHHGFDGVVWCETAQMALFGAGLSGLGLRLGRRKA
jgi:hypothetical protein